nr:hypothetical protein [Tanacetum cinerariifolium]
HVEFLENKAIEKGVGPNWLFDIDFLTKSMNYVPVDAGTHSTILSGIKDAANQEVKKDVSSLRYIVLLNWAHDALLESTSSKPHDESSSQVPKGNGNPNPPADQIETLTVESPIPNVSSPVPTACLNDSPEPSNILGVTTSSDEAIRLEADESNMETTISASPTPTLRIHKDHPKSQIIGPVDTPIQIRHKSKENLRRSLMLCKTQAGWKLCKKSSFNSKSRKSGLWLIVLKSLVEQGHTQEEGIDYDEVFAPVARIKAIRLFLAYASFMGFTVYHMDVKSAFLYGTIDEEVYVMQPLRFQDLAFPARVYKVEKAMGTIDQTLFIRRQREDFILVQVYMDDIIFGSSNP